MVGVGSWYGRSRWEIARCSKWVAGVGRTRRVAARCSMRVADIGRGWYVDVPVHWINRAVSMRLLIEVVVGRTKIIVSLLLNGQGNRRLKLTSA